MVFYLLLKQHSIGKTKQNKQKVKKTNNNRKQEQNQPVAWEDWPDQVAESVSGMD